MSAFDEPGYGMAESESRRCKRDYEKLIKGQKERNEASSKLYDSLIYYIDVHGTPSREKQFTLQHLMGTLLLEMRSGTKQIEQLIKEQEEDK